MPDRLNRHDLSDAEWERLRVFLPSGPQQRGGRWADHRTVINGIFFRTPAAGPGRGARGGTCRRASGTGRPSITGIAAGRWTGPGSRSWTGCGPAATRPRARTGQSARTPPSPGPISTRPAPAASRLLMTPRGALANDTKSGREAIGRSRGGLTTQIHLAADLRCRPIARLTSCGQHGDCPRFSPLRDAIRITRRGLGRPRQRPGRAMADKAYSSRANRAWLRRHGIQAVIPVKEDQKKHRRDRGRAGGRPPAFDASWYKKRNTVERCFAKLKQFRAVATRYDKRERIYQGTIDVASISIWLRDPVQ